ncbi:hypothetical protein ABZ619_38855 [Streptomyces sp. NPDC007851]|uniref:hypothetical protein n=1 Tax=Streptomyces sp. NPDC007851 TaxID=3155008 RepID=UPI00340D8D57
MLHELRTLMKEADQTHTAVVGTIVSRNCDDPEDGRITETTYRVTVEAVHAEVHECPPPQIVINVTGAVLTPGQLGAAVEQAMQRAQHRHWR